MDSGGRRGSSSEIWRKGSGANETQTEWTFLSTPVPQGLRGNNRVNGFCQCDTNLERPEKRGSQLEEVLPQTGL